MDYPKKPAPVDREILDVIQKRWSPLAFSPEPLSEDVIARLFEAARWAPSSFNEQPWTYVYAAKGDKNREALESLLVEGNSWAKDAGLLVISFAKKLFAKNGKPNYHHMHDIGAATGYLVLQATSMDLISHQMEGFDKARANEVAGVPDTHVPGSMIAIGRCGDPSLLPEKLKEREEKPRVRLPISEFAHRNRWQSRG